MRRAVAVLFIVGCLCAWVPAGSIYSFDQGGAYTVPAGSTVSIPVYLELSGTELTTAQTDGGMFQIGVRLTEDVGLTTASQPAFIATNADIQPNNLDFDPLFALTPPLLPYTGVSVQSDGPTGPVTSLGQPTGRILIGNFVFTGGNVAGETTVFDALDPDPMTNDTLTWNNSVLDPQMVASVLITTTAPLSPASVPVPAAAGAGLALLGILVAGRMARRWRQCA